MALKFDRLYHLEQREHALEEELAIALLQYPADDPMVAEMKRRRLYLRNELRHLQYSVSADERLR